MNDRYADLEDHERARALVAELQTVLHRLSFEAEPGRGKPTNIGEMLEQQLALVDSVVGNHALYMGVPGWRLAPNGRVLAPNETFDAAEFMRQTTA